MFKEGNEEYLRKYGPVFKRFDVRVLKDKIWKSYKNVICFYLFKILLILNVLINLNKFEYCFNYDLVSE